MPRRRAMSGVIVIGALSAIFVGASVAHAQTGCGRNGGPDVIVGVLSGVSSYGSVGSIAAFAVGTTSCNVGDVVLLWEASNNRHPVIGQDMFRLKAGRFEQIGMSWLKHGFLALAGNACGCGCQNPGTGTRLGVGCSDPYSSGLNGIQSGLGPRFEVNANTGAFSYPFAFQGNSGDAIYKRLQVHHSDLDPALNVGALYFVSAHYVTPDDAAAGAQDNNVSYQQINVSAGGGSYSISLTDSTQRELSPVEAWRDEDSDVVIRKFEDPDGGLFILGYKCSENPDGTFHYEYALYNMNSHRSARSFGVPIPAGVNVSNVRFHDVDYHSGEPYDGTTWTAAESGGALTWSTQSFAENEFANALRWGTLYNFRFNAESAPQRSAAATVGFFRPDAGAPDSAEVVVCAPSPSVLECVSVSGPAEPPLSSHALNAKNRYLSTVPANPGVITALQVTLVASEQFPDAVDRQWWVGAPTTYCENGGQILPPCDSVPGVPSSTFSSADLACVRHCRDWGALGGVLHIGDRRIVPDAAYEIRTIACGCDPNDPVSFSAPLSVATSRWSDTNASCAGCPCGPPEGSVNIGDCKAVIDRFVNASCAPIKARVDLEPESPDRQINITDVNRCIEGFQGLPFPFSEPPGCSP